MSLGDWIITKRGEFSEIRLMHFHGKAEFPFREFCCMDENGNWYCEGCHEPVPIEMVYVAELAKAVPIDQARCECGQED